MASRRKAQLRGCGLGAIDLGLIVAWDPWFKTGRRRTEESDCLCEGEEEEVLSENWSRLGREEWPREDRLRWGLVVGEEGAEYEEGEEHASEEAKGCNILEDETTTTARSDNITPGRKQTSTQQPLFPPTTKR